MPRLFVDGLWCDHQGRLTFLWRRGESSDMPVRSAFVLSTDFRHTRGLSSFHRHSRTPIAVHLDVWVAYRVLVGSEERRGLLFINRPATGFSFCTGLFYFILFYLLCRLSLVILLLPIACIVIWCIVIWYLWHAHAFIFCSKISKRLTTVGLLTNTCSVDIVYV